MERSPPGSRDEPYEVVLRPNDSPLTAVAGTKKRSPEALARLAGADRLKMALALRAAVKKRGRDPSQLDDFALELLAEIEDALKFNGDDIPKPGPTIALIEKRHRMFLECCAPFRDQTTHKLNRRKAYDAFKKRRHEHNKTASAHERISEPANNAERELEFNALFQIRKQIDRGEKPYPLETQFVRRIHASSHADTLADVADDLRGAPARQREHAEFVARWNESHRADIEAGNLSPMSDDFDELNP